MIAQKCKGKAFLWIRNYKYDVDLKQLSIKSTYKIKLLASTTSNFSATKVTCSRTHLFSRNGQRLKTGDESDNLQLAKVRMSGEAANSNVKAQGFLEQYVQKLLEPHSGSLSNEDLKVLCTHNEPAIVDSEEDSSHHQISEIIDQFVEDDPDFERGCKARWGVLKIL
ncbi:hypothetical protein T11_7112 [Trichinella zimbabwensis]|uniref:Uncharacterized protein n=1 Tax=Trichinella zimbabwensis TaxID=268475 RepID=A0A0V1HF04_9BILA|nr:hypothetical protein T11_7112 [Trichinella zimbabwensis]